ncbi:MAG: quinolinate synthase NadA [Candidatus Hodarchaeota archaeon]
MDIDTMKKEIQELKKETNSIILAHLYQIMDVQELGDFVGDSLGLSRKAAEIEDAGNIIFAAVDFMAETAVLMNPGKNVLLPDVTASCPMAGQLKAKQINEYKAKHSGLPVVLYVNTLAEAKAASDVVCTSANAVKICKEIAKERETNDILFGPDKNLGAYVKKITGINTITIPDRGYCYVHDQFVIEDVNQQRANHPDAKLIVHPECKSEIQDAADFVGSTSQMLKYVADSDDKKFIIGTEQGLVEKLKVNYPKREFYSLAMGGSICKNMKKTSVAKIHALMLKIKDGTFKDHLVTLEDDVIEGAKRSIEYMFELMKR